MEKINFSDIPKNFVAKRLLLLGCDSFDPNILYDNSDKQEMLKGIDVVKKNPGLSIDAYYYFGDLKNRQPHGYGVKLLGGQVEHGLFEKGQLKRGALVTATTFTLILPTFTSHLD